ncbi:MAG: hypothetical protein V3S98_09460 [Dehalococcoidia bacterium]
MNIKEALTHMDPANDEQWTEDGSPRVDVIQELVGDKTITRAAITNAAPDFTRETAPAQSTETMEDADHAEPPAEGESEPEGQGQGDEAEAEAQEEVTAEGGTDEIDAGAHEADSETAPTEEPDEPVTLTEEQLAEAKAIIEARSAPEVVVEQAPLSKLEQAMANRDALSVEMDEAHKVASQAKDKANALSDQVNTLNRQIDSLEKLDPNHNTAGVRHFIRQQNKNRMERAMRLEKFIGKSGVNPNDLARELDVRSPIDRAMAGRKAPRGSQRPAMPARQV